jgi:hypothetical protein
MGEGAAAMRIRAPADDTRTPIHFIALIDISESMDDANKLTHVKHCLSLLLNFLTPADTISLITFGDHATVVLKEAEGTATSITSAKGVIHGIRTNGCTNLSAGIAAVSSILEPGGAKPVVLLLTDGHANRGVTTPAQLRAMTVALERRTPGLTFSFVAYGTDHNADLMKEMAEQHTTSYSIVDDMESAALTMGECLGGAASCYAQAVTVRCPPGTVAHGAYKAEENGRIRVGDLYAGSEICILLDVPAAGASEWSVEGITLPALESFRIEPVVETATEPCPDIQLARLQIRCSALYHGIRVGTALESLRPEFEAVRAALQATAFDGHPIAEMLRQEIPSLEVAFSRGGTGATHTALAAQLAAHEHYVLLGRGTSQPIQLSPPTVAAGWGGQHSWRGHMTPVYSPCGTDDEDDNPVAPAPARRTNTSYLSPTASIGARRVAAAMRELSQVVPSHTEEEEREAF